MEGDELMGIMGMFANKDNNKLFVSISCIGLSFIGLSQLLLWLSNGSPHLGLLTLSLLMALSVWGSCYWYVNKQNRMMENAANEITRFLTGGTETRIECDSEGSLYKLFHAVNTLATTFDAHASKEQQTKQFLKNTISDISHQLKTPLAALAVYNSILQDDHEDKAAIRRFALKSEQEIERIETLVQNLLKMTKLDAGSIVIEKRPENIAEMMNDVRLHFETRAIRERKTIAWSGPQQAELLCDRGWMFEAVSNVVKNALDHTEAGGRISVEWSRSPAVAQIAVKDNGSGIRPEDIHHIFKRFYRSRFSKDTRGVGLGLPLTKAIVEAHDGNITADSAWGTGSTFVMSFLHQPY